MMSDNANFWRCEICHVDNNNHFLICTVCEVGANPNLYNESKSDDKNAWDTLSEDSDSIVQVIENYAILMFLILL